MAVTLREVAKAAGVSAAAASNVLHGSANGTIRVSEEKARKVRDVARKLNYHPNALARGLRSNKTHTVGLFFEAFGDISSGPLYLPKLIGGLGTRLFPNHYRLTLLPELEQDNILGTLGNGLLDGVVWCKLARTKKIEQQIRRCPIPIVAFNAGKPASGTGAVYISCDNEAGIELAVDHLWTLGHRRILFAFEDQEYEAPDRIVRHEAFLSAMAERGVDAASDVAQWSWEMDQFGQWWSSHPPHTAIIGWTERVAAKILERAAEAGVSIPGDLSVVGFDSTPFCDAVQPRLTAVRQPIFEMAQHAADVLLEQIRGQQPEQDCVVFPCTLDVRDSTTYPSQR